MKKIVVLSTVLLLFVSLAAYGQTSAKKGNVCYVESVTGKKGAPIPVKVFLTNIDTLAGMQVPIKFGSETVKLRCDSITFKDSRCSHFEFKSAQIDSVGHVAYFSFIYMTNPENEVLPLMPGDGLVATIWFTAISAGKDGQLTLEGGTKAFLHNEYGIDQSFLFWTPKAQPVECSYTPGIITVK